MKKRIVALLLALSSAFAVCSLGGCKKKNPEASRMTVEINPKVEFILDKDNKVVSATALNDDGAVILAGEASFNGKTAEEAAEAVVSIATETGYIVKGSATVEDNKINISISGDTSYAKDLYGKVEKKVEKYMKDNGINAKLEKIDAMTLEELKALALKNPERTEDDVKDKTEEQLIAMIKLDRIETAELATEELKDAYFKAKAYQIAIVNREETAKVIEGMGDAYAAALGLYDKALETYGKAIQAMEDTRYKTLVSPDSAYQKLLAQLRDKKAEVLKERSITFDVTIDDEKRASAELRLKASEEAYNELVKKIVEIGNQADAAWTQAIDFAKTCETAFEGYKELLPSKEDFEKKLNDEAAKIETAVNNAKNSFFETFEDAHGEDIKKAKADLEAYKQKLKDQAAGKTE
ncbi:MAG: hypothetical protein PUH93_01865 [Clostridia bacterium]|nr:hypothetical protein [Clostridia bacterium]